MVELVRKHKNNGNSGVGITSTPIHEVVKLEYIHICSTGSDISTKHSAILS